MNRQEELLTDWRREGRWEMVELRTVNNRSQRTSFSVTHAWHWWNTHSDLWKLKTWRSVCRGLTVQGLLHVLILLSRFPPLYITCSNQSPRNHSLFPYPNIQSISNSVFEFLQTTSSSPPLLTPKSKALWFARTNAAAWQSGLCLPSGCPDITLCTAARTIFSSLTPSPGFSGYGGLNLHHVTRPSPPFQPQLPRLGCTNTPNTLLFQDLWLLLPPSPQAHL